MYNLELDVLHEKYNIMKRECLDSMRKFVDTKTEDEMNICKMMVDINMTLFMEVIREIDDYNLKLNKRA